MINVVTLLGRLTKDPEIKKTNSGKSVLSFTIAVDRFRKEDGADFINCQAWEKTAEFIANYFSKGSPIAISGRLSTRTYEDKDGNKRQATEIIVNDVSFCGGKGENDGNAKPKGKANVNVEVDEIDDDEDLPF